MSKMEYVSYFRPEIDNMGGYTPGEQPKMANLLKLNTNESPYPPSPGVSEVLKNFDCEKLRLYPDPTAEGVREIIANMFGLTKDHVIAGNGSDDILTIAMRCFASADKPAASRKNSCFPAT